jgi:hypothetical protein
VDRDLIIELCRPYFSRLIQCQRRAFEDFDQTIPPDVRVTVERSRPNFVYGRTIHHFELEFGRAGTARVVDGSRLTYLFIEGANFNVGIRCKKLSGRCLSYNHTSWNQENLRGTGCFPEWNLPTAHIFLGYRMRQGLEPAITDIALSSEYRDGNGRWRLNWRHLLWTAGEGENPIRPIQPDLPLLPPPPPRVRRKRRPDEASENNEEPTG